MENNRSKQVCCIKFIHLYLKITKRRDFWLSYVSLYRLNIILKDILPYEKETQYIFFPPMILHENPICIKLFISNPTSVNATWDIKRMQLCFCKMISKTRGLSFRYVEFDCIHRKVCSIYPQSGLVKVNKTINYTYSI